MDVKPTAINNVLLTDSVSSERRSVANQEVSATSKKGYCREGRKKFSASEPTVHPCLDKHGCRYVFPGMLVAKTNMFVGQENVCNSKQRHFYYLSLELRSVII